MLKKILFISCLLLLSNCSAPGTALLGPAFTGAKTGSIYQTSLSFSTGKIVNEIADFTLDTVLETKEKVLTAKKNIESMPDILKTYAVNKIKVSEVMEPEPLP
tara:strand:- start:3540 stop:3848 length:309 start_codon:yes stop_codon:yes gene_type:complete